MKGARNVSRNPSPRSEAGRTIQTGQIKVMAPRTPAIPVALFTLSGQLPILDVHATSPLVKDSISPSKTVNRMSASVAGGRGSERKTVFRSPSSHPKNAPVIKSDAKKGSQNIVDRNIFVMVELAGMLTVSRTVFAAHARRTREMFHGTTVTTCGGNLTFCANDSSISNHQTKQSNSDCEPRRFFLCGSLRSSHWF
jgi:hypothetical protein